VETRAGVSGAVRVLGAGVLETVRFVGGVSLLIRDVVVQTVTGPFRGKPPRFKEFWHQAVRVGPRSLFIVFVVNFFVGVILALIGGDILQDLGFTRYVGNLMSVGIVVELGPLLTGMIMTGFIGAALAAEISTMVVQEEVTALKTMAMDPVWFVVSPRLFAAVFMIPCVTMLGDFLGILGGCLIAVSVLDVTAHLYFQQAWDQLSVAHVWRGAVKTSVFGLIVGAVGCYQGFQVKGGAEGVGRVTTNAVVTSILAIIISDAILDYFLLFRF
jgi:phospholipid/cholesterol/gamma-HCH transport system permease protein